MPSHRPNWRRSLRSLYVWHRWLGVTSALLVLWLSATGILLNHSTELGWHRADIRAAWLLRAYGITPSLPTRGFRVSGRWLSQAGDQLFLDTQPVAELAGELVGVIALGSGAGASPRDSLVVASQHNLLMLTPEGELIERLAAENLPGPILAISRHEDGLVLQTTDGLFLTDNDLMGFTAYAGDWPQSVAEAGDDLPENIAQGIVAAGGGISLSRERVLADLHSGRLFGRYGPVFMDLAALAFMILALSGLWLWWRHRQTQQQRHRPS